MKDNAGYVYIIGAGPGDPELLTVKAERVLHEVDVILYDNLVSSELVGQFDALKIYTGKRKDKHHFAQDAINQEIVFHAKLGRKVARLKGGDPYVFGRGGEEIAFLRKHGIEYEIIPGITAAHGASAYTEIPLTIRHVSSSVAFCTGHPLDKIHVPDADTVVYYMVASSASDVAEALIGKGKEEKTKVAIVQNATRYNQKIFTGTLGELRNKDKKVVSPALLILGENITEFIDDYWFGKKKRVLIAGTGVNRYENDKYVVVRYSCNDFKHNEQEHVKEKVEDISEELMLLFPDKYAVRYFFNYLFEQDLNVGDFVNTVFCPVGTAASAELLKHGVLPDLCLDAGTSEEIVVEMKSLGITDENIVIPCSGFIDDYLVDELTSLKNSVIFLDVSVQPSSTPDERIELDCIDEIYFSSPECVRLFKTMYTEIPEKITVRTADSKTDVEYMTLFDASLV
ncbi:uroporphyrinogen-III C-methyltransferase [Prosthecochloris sp. SCSIO W1101]|uniref:uroporphyrinogen-III C-methyltransferase n=1 Tax=Prosthecochloris sp. SCSIO W1101 TaxID=2992242 RepID=UPI00223DF070|nr:uroporphyrinogen-III C-methyltransferase [Prosthecochloris sp. SCSIO W1101]UZJ42032.1 uroporphyrinogen-III C-methyltransferase [Prosthecochloris sp. SCSIO W1101]